MHDITLKDYTDLGKTKNKILLGGRFCKSPIWNHCSTKSNYDTSRRVANSNTRGSPLFPPHSMALNTSVSTDSNAFVAFFSSPNGAHKHLNEHFEWKSNSILPLRRWVNCADGPVRPLKCSSGFYYVDPEWTLTSSRTGRGKWQEAHQLDNR